AEGLSVLTLSYDRYHAKFQGPEPGRNILRAAEELAVQMNVNITRVTDDTDIAELIKPFDGSRHAKVRFYDVQPVGRARDFPAESLRGEMEGACTAACTPAVTDNGRLTACNGPSYFQPSDSPLNLGSIRESSLTSLLRKHRDDPILQTVRAFGPSRLRQELSLVPGFENFPWKTSYSGLCDLCLHVNSDARAVAALRERLSRPELAAERKARDLVVEGVRCRGEIGREHSIGVAAARLWMSGARSPEVARSEAWSARAAQAFGRADCDWRHMADNIAACGLSGVVLPLVANRPVARWAPALFTEHIKREALKQGRRELVHRAALSLLDKELAELGATAVLLKGAAFLALDRRDVDGSDSSGGNGLRAGRLPRRAPGDIDILVSGGTAGVLRKRLLERGWTGEKDARRTGPHHLAPVSFSGLSAEIHTRIMPGFWQLPEREMLAHSLPAPGFRCLSTLDIEGMVLHTLMHCAAHLFGLGLKAAWDVAWLVERAPALDVDRLRDWADRCAMPAGYYLPAKVIRTALDVPIPSKLLAGAPHAPRFAALERVIGRRMFIAMEGAYELNPFTTHGIFLMLHNTWRGRALHLASLFGRDERESRFEASAHFAARAQPLAAQIRESAAHWRSYRKVASM
nr:nucleotidyltransferase family protein [Gemmatimonadota bacterium]